jgi:hypothetical protein
VLGATLLLNQVVLPHQVAGETPVCVPNAVSEQPAGANSQRIQLSELSFVERRIVGKIQEYIRDKFGGSTCDCFLNYARNGVLDQERLSDLLAQAGAGFPGTRDALAGFMISRVAGAGAQHVTWAQLRQKLGLSE